MRGGNLLISRIRSCLWLFGWVAFIHLLTSLLGFDLLALAFDPLGGGSQATMPGLCMVLAWFISGWLTPKKARGGWKCGMLVLGTWAILSEASYLIWGEILIIHVIPQYLTGIGLAELWPGNHYTKWFLDVLEPVMMTASHFLLPAMLGLGMLLPPKTSK